MHKFVIHINMAESTDSSQGSESNSNQREESDILTICDSSKDEGGTDTSVTICMYMTLYILVLRCSLAYNMNIV